MQTSSKRLHHKCISSGDAETRTHWTRDEQLRPTLRSRSEGRCAETMIPELLLLLLLLAESSADPHEDDAGKEFIVVFPENIAYYHPILPTNRIQVTALGDSTEVQLRMHTFGTRTETLSAGQTKEFIVDSKLELQKTNVSDNTVVITSSRKITVQATSLKLNSVQTALVIPANKLSKEYRIPPVPHIQGTTDRASLDVTERRPFTLFIISGRQSTKVTIEGASAREVWLQPRHVAQVLVQQADQLRAVSADQPVAVLFGHACAIRHDCTCGLLQSTLWPARKQRLRFLVPPVLAQNNSLLLTSSEESTTIRRLDPDWPLVETNGTAILYQPGLLLTLIPETSFASCFIINGVQGADNFAVIVVHKYFISGVRIGNVPLENPSWQQLGRTEFVSTKVRLQLGKKVIWHTSHKMAVYFHGRYGTAQFGSPAPVLSRTADFRGCLLDPEVVHVGQVAAGWRESVQYCRARQLQLVSLSDGHNVTHIYREVTRANSDGVWEVWIGMRRSSQTGDWYWLNNDPVQATNWEEGEPGLVDNGQCAIMSLRSGREFGWSNEDCCKAIHPVCYRQPVFFPLE